MMAAWVLCNQGIRPLVLAAEQGTTHWTSGTIDVFGYESSAIPVESPRQALERLVAAEPTHPYARSR